MFGRIIDYNFDGKNHVILTDKCFKITFRIEGEYISYIRKYGKSDAICYNDRNVLESNLLNKNFKSLDVYVSSSKQHRITPFNIISKPFKTEFKFKWIYFRLKGEDEDWVIFKDKPNFKLPKAEIKVELVS